jgi:octaprenyl-diphosphate synthase
MANILSATAPREMQATAQEIFRSIQSEMDAVEEEFEKRARSNIQIITRIGQYLYQTGGKRVRPALLILSAKIFGEEVDTAIIQMATVMEFLHTATLVHDDVIDGAEMRRGCQAVSTEWGNETAVLMGDWLYMSAFETALQQRNLAILDALTDDKQPPEAQPEKGEQAKQVHLGDGAAEVEQVAGGGAVFVGVLEVGVELVGQPVFGVVGQQA